jgi:hypothetical protein
VTISNLASQLVLEIKSLGQREEGKGKDLGPDLEYRGRVLALELN